MLVFAGWYAVRTWVVAMQFSFLTVVTLALFIGSVAASAFCAAAVVSSQFSLCFSTSVLCHGSICASVDVA